MLTVQRVTACGLQNFIFKNCKRRCHRKDKVIDVPTLELDAASDTSFWNLQLGLGDFRSYSIIPLMVARRRCSHLLCFSTQIQIRHVKAELQAHTQTYCCEDCVFRLTRPSGMLKSIACMSSLNKVSSPNCKPGWKTSVPGPGTCSKDSLSPAILFDRSTVYVINEAGV
jgi:hypothetical protein